MDSNVKIIVELSEEEGRKLRDYLLWSLENDNRPDNDEDNEATGTFVVTDLLDVLDTYLGEE